MASPGWHRGEWLAVDPGRMRVAALFCRDRCAPGMRVVARIVRAHDNIIVARA